METDPPDGQRGLSTVAFLDQQLFSQAFAGFAQPISDYTFANVFVWGTALKLYQTVLHDHLCVFANGTGDLTMLLPPLALDADAAGHSGGSGTKLRRALVEAFEVMDAYNISAGRPDASRIEYVSDEMLERINVVTGRGFQLSASPFSGDFVYPVGQLIDLPGGSLKSKRHGKTRFMREYPDHRVETLTDAHNDACFTLLDRWKAHADAVHLGQVTEDEAHVATQVLRAREEAACRMALTHREPLGLTGMVVFVGEKLVGFTLGERLSPLQASILVEKTDPDYHGVPQFIFSEFCRRHWAGYPEINVGDDWGIPSLRWTKESYRPSRRLSKYVLTRQPALRRRAPRPITERGSQLASRMFFPEHARPVETPAMQPAEPVIDVRPARLPDTMDLVTIEACSFMPGESFTRRQIHDLIAHSQAICRVATVNNEPAGWCVGLVRRHRAHLSGRIYNLAIDPNHRRRGLGRRLMQHMISEMAARNVRHLYLEVNAANHRAIALYESLGFKSVRKLPDYYGDGEHGLSMRLAIPARDAAATDAVNAGTLWSTISETQAATVPLPVTDAR